MENFLYSIITRAVAADNPTRLDLSKINVAGTSDFGAIWNRTQNLVFGFLAVAAFAGIVYAGITMITSGGDAAKFAVGRKNLIWSIIGIIVVVLAYFIIKFVYSLNGAILGPVTP